MVVEGYTDVIAFHLAERPVAVATCGTALGDEHLALLKRFSERIVLAFDGDAAGVGAALRGFDKAVPGDLDLRVGLFPEGRDPADLVAGGDTDGLDAAMADSVPLLQFRIEQELAGFDLDETEARAKAAVSAARLVALHPEAVVRHEYAVLVSRRTGVDLEVVERAVRGALDRPRAQRRDVETRKLTGVEKAERELLRLLLANDAGLRSQELDEQLFSDPEHRAAFAAVVGPIMAMPAGDPPDLGTMLGEMGDMGRTLSALALEDRPLSEPAGVVTRLRTAALERRITSARHSLSGLDHATQAYSDAFENLIALERERNELKGRR